MDVGLKIWGLACYSSMDEASVARESAWLFCPLEIWATFIDLNCVCNEWTSLR